MHMQNFSGFKLKVNNDAEKKRDKLVLSDMYVYLNWEEWRTFFKSICCCLEAAEATTWSTGLRLRKQMLTLPFFG